MQYGRSSGGLGRVEDITERASDQRTACAATQGMSIFLPCVLSDRPPVLWWLSPSEGREPLRDAVWINCKMGTTTENQEAVVTYMGYGVYI